MKSQSMKYVLLSAGVLALPCSVAMAGANFLPLGVVPGSGTAATYANGLSADGSVAVGGIPGQGATRWDNGVPSDLPGHPSQPQFSAAQTVTRDGSIVAGSSTNPGTLGGAAIWDINGVRTDLGFLPGGQNGAGFGISDNGSVVVGVAQTAVGATTRNHGFRWESGVMTDLGILGSDGFITGSDAQAVSADGSVVVGFSSSPGNGTEAYRWENGVMVGLGGFAGVTAKPFSRALDITGDATVIVGQSDLDRGSNAFRWENGVMEPLGSLPGGRGDQSIAFGVSDDGNTIVGESKQLAFIWDAAMGMRPLIDVLQSDYGLDLTGWTLTSASDISADGFTISGTGINPLGINEGWIVSLVPEPSALAFFGLGALSLTRRRRK